MMNVSSSNRQCIKGGQLLNLNKRLLSSSSTSAFTYRDFCNSDSFLFPMMNSREPTILQQHQRLVNALFRFLVTLTYQYRVISSSLTSIPPASTLAQSKHLDSGNSEKSATSPASTTSSAINGNDESIDSRLVELSQVGLYFSSILFLPNGFGM